MVAVELGQCPWFTDVLYQHVRDGSKLTTSTSTCSHCFKLPGRLSRLTYKALSLDDLSNRAWREVREVLLAD